MGGTLEYGEEVKVVSHETPEIVSEVVDQRDLITVAVVPPTAFAVGVVNQEVYATETLVTDFEAAVEDTTVTATAVYAPYVPTEYEDTLLMLYQEYGPASVSKALFGLIETVVNENAPDATAGIY